MSGQFYLCQGDLFIILMSLNITIVLQIAEEMEKERRMFQLQMCEVNHSS